MDQEALLTGTAEPLARQRGGGLAERLRRDAPLAALDLGVAFFCYMLTLALRFDGSVPDRYWSSFWRFLPIALAIHLVVAGSGVDGVGEGEATAGTYEPHCASSAISAA